MATNSGYEAWDVCYKPPRDGACDIALLGDYAYMAGVGLDPGRYWDCVTIKYDQQLGVAEQKLSPVTFSCAPLTTVVSNRLYLLSVPEKDRSGVNYVAAGTSCTARVAKGD